MILNNFVGTSSFTFRQLLTRPILSDEENTQKITFRGVKC